ncbi:anthranilate phosphoribosyltransferase [Sporobolomyces salmoneus]|uniref:anthranilate phosphoribosyltransferase n=1 Tax=Sporobolomyces salmoneus TaxID=183962 RepID=UPI003175B1E1
MDSTSEGVSNRDPTVTSMIDGGAPPTATSSSVPVPPSESPYTPATFAPLLKKLVLSPSSFTLSDCELSFLHLAHGPSATHPSQIGAFLSALRMTGKDGEADVIACCAKIMRSHAVNLQLDAHEEEGGLGPVCDIVGTGGDGHNTFNVSTTAGIVAAGAGVRVFKHGNKAATSSSGSADILLSLGCPITTLPPSSISSLSQTCSFLFLFAPLYHPAMVHLAPIRKQLPFPTIFNVLGPLINPIRPKRLIIGVHSEYLGKVFAEALRLSGIEKGWVVCGKEGLDEISIAGETHVWEVGKPEEEIKYFTVHPSQFGLSSHPLSSVVGGTPQENSELLLKLLRGELSPDDPVENFVVLNAAALLLVCGVAKSEKEGVEMARKSLREGGAMKALEGFRDKGQEEVKKLA